MLFRRLLLALVRAAAVAAGNFLLGGDGLAWRVGAPFALALVVALLPSRAAAPPAREPAPPPPPPAEPAGAEALRPLGPLPEGGRFVDFVTEDPAPHPGEQIGPAAPRIPQGGRQAPAQPVAVR